MVRIEGFRIVPFERLIRDGGVVDIVPAKRIRLLNPRDVKFPEITHTQGNSERVMLGTPRADAVRHSDALEALRIELWTQ